MRGRDRCCTVYPLLAAPKQFRQGAIGGGCPFFIAALLQELDESASSLTAQTVSDQMNLGDTAAGGVQIAPCRYQALIGPAVPLVLVSGRMRLAVIHLAAF